MISLGGSCLKCASRPLVYIFKHESVEVPGSFAQSFDRGSDDKIGLRFGFEERSALGWAKRFVFAPLEVGSALHTRDITF